MIDYQQFAFDVLTSFSKKNKELPSKYFYDDHGSLLFAEIMDMKEYYVTECELEVFNLHSKEICEVFLNGTHDLNLIELGAGNGVKTKILLNYLYKKEIEIEYSPIDISKSSIDSLVCGFQEDFPMMKVNPFIGDYFQALNLLEERTKQRKVVMLLGTSIGNYTHDEAISLISQIKSSLQKDDLLLIGYDLKKAPKTILAAYDDIKGITKAFNLNLLTRMNRELGANFDLSTFNHYAIYEPISGEARSYLVSLDNQNVYFGALKKSFKFKKWEFIHTEISRKFNIQQIESMATETGFKVIKHFKDERAFFVDSLWEVL